MKNQYREVLFQDTRTGKTFLTRSTVETNQRARWQDGKEYPLFKIDISSDSHPVFTGQARSFAPTGRVEAFKKKYAKQ